MSYFYVEAAAFTCCTALLYLVTSVQDLYQFIVLSFLVRFASPCFFRPPPSVLGHELFSVSMKVTLMLFQF